VPAWIAGHGVGSGSRAAAGRSEGPRSALDGHPGRHGNHRTAASTAGPRPGAGARPPRRRRGRSSSAGGYLVPRAMRVAAVGRPTPAPLVDVPSAAFTAHQVGHPFDRPVSGGELAAQPAPAAAPNRPTFLEEGDPLLASRTGRPPARTDTPPASLAPANRPARWRPTRLQSEGQGDAAGQHRSAGPPAPARAAALARPPAAPAGRIQQCVGTTVTNIAARAARPTGRRASVASSIAMSHA
jgi:hypothetical protein